MNVRCRLNEVGSESPKFPDSTMPVESTGADDGGFPLMIEEVESAGGLVLIPGGMF